MELALRRFGQQFAEIAQRGRLGRAEAERFDELFSRYEKLKERVAAARLQISS